MSIIILSGGLFLVRGYRAITIEVPDVGGTYQEGLLKDPRAINPIYASQDTDRDIARLVFSGLTTYSGNGTMLPDLAEQIDISDDGKVYTVRIRKNVLWHDKKLFSVDDVVFTVKTVQNPQYKSPLRANWQGVNVEKIDPQTIRFTLRTPYAPFIENLTLGIIPKHLWEHVAPEQAILNELNIKPMGTGPYQFSRFKQNKDGSMAWYELKRNPGYYREKPYLKTIRFSFYKTEDEMLRGWRRGTIEGFGPVPAHRAGELSAKSQIVSIAMPRVFGIFMNEQHTKILADKKVREAIARAIDKDKVAREAISGGSQASETPFGLLSMSSGGTTIRYPYSPERARTLLEEGGWKDIDGDGIREKKTIQNRKEIVAPLNFTLTTSDWPDLLQTAELVKQMLRDVGVSRSSRV